MDAKWVNDALSQTTEMVFDSMVHMKVSAKKHEDELVSTNAHLTAMVGFAGEYMGLVAIHCSLSLARTMGAKMSSRTPDKLSEEDVRDAMGEIANIVAGHFKAKLSENLNSKESVFEQSVPSVISGEDYETSAVTDAPRYCIELESEIEKFYVELTLKEA